MQKQQIPVVVISATIIGRTNYVARLKPVMGKLMPVYTIDPNEALDFGTEEKANACINSRICNGCQQVLTAKTIFFSVSCTANGFAANFIE